MDNIGERLKYLRKDVLKITQAGMADKLNIAKSSISRIEAGTIKPLDRTICDICRVFKINEEWLRYGNGDIFTEEPDTDIGKLAKKYNLSTTEHNLLLSYIEMPEEDRKSITSFFQRFVELEMGIEKEIVVESKADNIRKINFETVELKVYEQKASAGIGNYFMADDDSYIMQQFDKKDVPKNADFCIYADGDSMMPKIEDNDLLFIKYTSNINFGEIGIFIVDNDVLCKKLERVEDNVVLRSLNPKYKDIVLNEYNYVKTIGRVIGV